MDISKFDNEFRVDEVAFWHTNMDLYYGYRVGELVEVEHEPYKYWLARIGYTFKNLILLKWVCNCGELWIDTAKNMPNGLIKRFYPPGYFLQPQLKSQYKLERPRNSLVDISIYNPAQDPYSKIKNVNDLVKFEDEPPRDAFSDQTSSQTNAAQDLAMSKCKQLITYRQEDHDELEAALESITKSDLDFRNDQDSETPEPVGLSGKQQDQNSSDINQISNIDRKGTCEQTAIANTTNTTIIATSSSTINSTIDSKSSTNTVCEVIDDATTNENSNQKTNNPINQQEEDPDCNEKVNESINDEEKVEQCKKIQESAIIENKNKLNGKLFHSKPKQLYDLGGANHERVLVPGTILEICHTRLDNESNLTICHWFAIITENIGGRLTLRWFLCDDPKFKQGRLELKTLNSNFILDASDVNLSNEADENSLMPTYKKIPVKEITFKMHYCNPRINTINAARLYNRNYSFPTKLEIFLNDLLPSDKVKELKHKSTEHIIDPRRINLDKDRPIIDHLLSTCRTNMPSYLNFNSSQFFDVNPEDLMDQFRSYESQDVWISSPRATRLIPGFIKKVHYPGVFEVHSKPLENDSEAIKFIFPYDSSYSMLPKTWAQSNPECLSIQLNLKSSEDGERRRSTPISPVVEPPQAIDQKNPNESVTNEEESEKVTNMVELDEKQNHEEKSIIDETMEACLPFKLEEEDEEVASPIFEKVADANNIDAESANAYHCVSTKSHDVVTTKELTDTIDESQHKVPDARVIFEYKPQPELTNRFRVMDQLEVVHPYSDVTICSGRIRRISPPLVWIQISNDSYTVLPFNSTDMYPTKWCEQNNHQLIHLLPARKIPPASPEKKRKRPKNEDSDNDQIDEAAIQSHRAYYEGETFDLNALDDNLSKLDSNYLLTERAMYTRIYFNHKCFTGPALSKGKICSLPQYVGPGPLRLVMEEVVTKLISVAYVPPRILNELSSKTFEELLTSHNITNTLPITFKAKYQKRVHREELQVIVNPDDVQAYCECICEHLKCCYNLFGPNLYDGDDCPGHCRALTKSNKFMKRATYYREKARLGEFTANDSAKKPTNSGSTPKCSAKTKNNGRVSADSFSSERVNSRASSNKDAVLADNLSAVEENDNDDGHSIRDEADSGNSNDNSNSNSNSYFPNQKNETDSGSLDQISAVISEQNENDSDGDCSQPIQVTQSETGGNCSMHGDVLTDDLDTDPLRWTVDDVYKLVERSNLSKFANHLKEQDIDGPAFMMLDEVVLNEHFLQPPLNSYTSADVEELGEFVERVGKRIKMSK